MYQATVLLKYMKFRILLALSFGHWCVALIRGVLESR